MIRYDDPRAVLCHFNPNHDKLGRFAKSQSGSISAKSVDKPGSTGYNKGESIDKEKLKKYAKIGAGVVAASLVVAGGIYLAKSGKFDEMVNAGRELTRRSISDVGAMPFGQKAPKNKTGKTPDDIDFDMVQRINGEDGYLVPGRDRNCAHTSTAYILNSMFDQDVEALPFNGVDEKSGLKELRDNNIFRAVFDGLEYHDCDPTSDTLLSVLEKQNPGTGIMRVFSAVTGPHFLNYEKSQVGDISVVDGQSGEVVFGKEGIDYLADNYRYIPTLTIDATNAVLRDDDNARRVLDVMVK